MMLGVGNYIRYEKTDKEARLLSLYNNPAIQGFSNLMVNFFYTTTC